MRDAPTMRAMVQWVSLVSVVTLAGCQSDVPPTIFPPPLPRLKIEKEFEAAALAQKGAAATALFKEGATAILPVFDAEGFFVSLPPQLAGDPVDQVLKAVGFDDETTGLEIRRAREVAVPAADLAGLASAVCRGLPKKKGDQVEKQKEKGGEARGICDALAQGFQPSMAMDKLLKASYGMNFQQFKNVIERREVQTFFQQFREVKPNENPNKYVVAKKVPIEHLGFFARGGEREKGKFVAGRVITIKPEVLNEVRINEKAAADAAKEALENFRGISSVQTPDRVELLLLPYGEAKRHGRRVPALRYVYRMPIVAEYGRQKGLFYVWLDAKDGSIRALQPLLPRRSSQVAVPAQGWTFNRHAGLALRVTPDPFEVDAAANGWYVLQLSGVFGRVDRRGDNLFDDEVSIPENTDGSSPTFANFEQPKLRDPAKSGFEEVDLLATLNRYRKMANEIRVFQPFPAPLPGKASGQIRIAFAVESDWSCGGYARADSITFGRCSNGQEPIRDHTVVAHEMGHLLTLRQTMGRPADWCNGPASGEASTAPCSLPSQSVPIAFHDFADTWAHAFENTNCFGGWVGNSPACKYHDEDGGLQRKADPDSDHFPEHRHNGYQGDYADMQIAAAALWAVRQGVLSKDASRERTVGAMLFLTRFAGALRTIGWFGKPPNMGGWYGLEPLTSARWFGVTTITNTDRDIYLGLLDLEIQLANQWAQAGSTEQDGAHVMNKVTAGFARAGIFMVPVVCIDGDPSTTDQSRCLETEGGESGGDAVIQVDDNDPNDDIPDPDGGFVHPEWDYLKRDGWPPSFRIWTGPRYVFDSDGQAQLPEKTGRQAPCNTHFEIEVSDQVDSMGNLTGTVKNSGELKVEVAPQRNSSTLCYGVWTIPQTDWDALDDGERIYYKVKTWSLDAKSGKVINERDSTKPGNGLFRVTPPYAVVTNTGSPEDVTPPPAAPR